MRTVALALLVGCNSLKSDTGDTADTGVPPTNGCPSGAFPATTSAMSITEMEIDLVNYAAAFDPTATYSGVPAACESSDGRSATFTFTVAGIPYGTLSIQAVSAGTFDLAADHTNQIGLDITGATPPFDISPTSWTSGSAVIGLAPLTVSLNGTYVSASSAVVQMSVQAPH